MKQASLDGCIEGTGDLFYILTIGHTIHILDYVESSKKITVNEFTSRSKINSRFRQEGEQGMYHFFVQMRFVNIS